MLRVLAITRQPELLSRLQTTLRQLPGPALVGAAMTSAAALRQLAAPPELVIAEVDTLARAGWEACRAALARRAGSQPLIAILAEDSPAELQAASDMLANSYVLLTDLDECLLPAAERLLGSVPLLNGVTEHIVEAASHASPLGEPAFDRVAERLGKLSDHAVERLQPSLEAPGGRHAAPRQDADGNPVFLRGLRLLCGASPSAGGRQVHRSVCSLNCGNHFCGLKVTTRNGHVEQIEPADFPDERYRRVCLKGISQLQLTSHPDRLQTPLKQLGARGEDHWQPVSWEQALDEITRRMRVIDAQYGPESMMFFTYSGQISALNGFSGVYLRLASQLGASGTSVASMGTDSAVPSGIEETFGAGTGYLANDYTDLANSRLVLIWGADPVKSRLNWWQFFAEAQKSGTRLIAIDPKYSATASKSDEWVAVRPGSDLYLALGMLHLIVRNGWANEDYVRAHTVGPLLVRADTGAFLRADGEGPELVWDETAGAAVPAGSSRRPALRGEYRVRGVPCRPAYDLLCEMVEPYAPALVAERTGVPAAQVEALAEVYASTKPARIYTLYGVDRWHHGATFGRLIATLGALTGNIGIPGGGAGVDGMNQPVLLLTGFTYPGGNRYREVNPARLTEYILKGEPYPIKGMWVAFSNWLNQWPDQNALREQVLPQLDLVVTAEMFMTETARWSDYVLPVASMFERPDIVRGPGPFVQYQPAIVPPPGECRSDFDIAQDVAARLGHTGLFAKTPDEYIAEMLASEPDLSALSFDELRETGVLRIPGSFETVAHRGGVFPTRTGRAEFYSERLLPLGRALPSYEAPIEADPSSAAAARYPLVCINDRSRYRVHSTFSTAWWLRELDAGPAVTMSPADASARGVAEGDTVRVFNDRGYVVLRAEISKCIPAGCVYVDEGWQSTDYIDGHLQTLTHTVGNEANVFGSNSSFSDVLVEVVRERGEA